MLAVDTILCDLPSLKWHRENDVRMEVADQKTKPDEK